MQAPIPGIHPAHTTAAAPPRLASPQAPAHLVGDGADGLRHAHHQLAQLGVIGSLQQELLQGVANLRAGQGERGRAGGSSEKRRKRRDTASSHVAAVAGLAGWLGEARQDGGFLDLLGALGCPRSQQQQAAAKVRH